MGKVAGLEIVLTVNGKNVALGAETLGRIVSYLPDNDNYTAIFAELAKSTSFEVRENVASKDHLNSDTVALLADDQVEEVLANLIRSDAAKLLSQGAIDKLIAKSPKLAADIVNYIEKFEDLDTSKILESLATSTDPSVRKSVAGCYEAPKKVLKSLLKDEDPDVVSEAIKTLE